MEEHEFLNLNPWTHKNMYRIHVFHHGLRFSNLVLSWVLLWAIPGLCTLQVHLWVLVILFSCYSFNQPFCYVLSVPIFYPKLFCFLCIQLLVCIHVFSTYLLVGFSFIVFKWPVCSNCLTFTQYLLSLPSFTNTFWFIHSLSIFWVSLFSLIVFLIHPLKF